MAKTPQIDPAAASRQEMTPVGLARARTDKLEAMLAGMRTETEAANTFTRVRQMGPMSLLGMMLGWVLLVASTVVMAILMVVDSSGSAVCSAGSVVDTLLEPCSRNDAAGIMLMLGTLAAGAVIYTMAMVGKGSIGVLGFWVWPLFFGAITWGHVDTSLADGAISVGEGLGISLGVLFAVAPTLGLVGGLLTGVGAVHVLLVPAAVVAATRMWEMLPA